MYSTLSRKALLLYLNTKYGDKHWYHYYQELQGIQWWPAEQLEALQLERLKALLKHAYQNVPYYRKKFTGLGLHPDDIKTLDDLVKLPILTKKDIRDNLPGLVASNFPQNKLIPSATGGSTGEPLQFYTTEESRNRGSAAAHLAYLWYGYEWGDKLAHLWGSPRDVSVMRSLPNKILPWLLRSVYLNAFNMSESNMAEFAQKLSRFKPKLIIAYASAAYLFARYLKHKEIGSIRPKAVVTEAEKLLPEQRKLIQEVFGCEVADLYGSREMSTMAAECPQHNGYHIFTPNVILEFIKNNKPVLPGETGKIIVTNLHNYAMPFIRYENGDLGVPSDEKCPCGRSLPMMKEVVGRTTDILVIGDKFISSPSLTLLFKDLPIKQYQLVQGTETEITIKIVKGDEYCDKHTEQIRSLIQNYLGSNINITIELVTAILPSESGKHRFIISRVPLKF